ncbi:MAG: hypothetical protein BGO01_19225 [Armatimonadetes bacterium 55-13]|nr:membrane protein insertase YidC [Armatimonadota bacterium]OJU64252.1 MAG: hypothetical protein BGO01_19225 [Armatimonadetes bacterium 55-13]
MSRPAPTPKQNFLQTLLIVTTVFLGMQLFCNKPQQNTADSNRTTADVLKSMREMNSKLLDVSIVRENSALNSKIHEETNAKKLTEQQAEALRIEGSILVADTQLKAGMQRNETQRIRQAYYSLDTMNRKKAGLDEWNKTTVEIPKTVRQPERFTWSQWTGHELYQKVVSELTTRNKTDLVWGFMPGGYQFVDLLVHATGSIPAFSYWFAALLLALVVRGVVYPLTQRQLMWSRQMSQLTPMLKEIKERYKDSPQTQQTKTMELYREYGINPMAGCGPALVQMPLFLFVYQCMLHYQFEFQKGTFLWINASTSQATKGFIAPNLGQVDTILIILYGISLCTSTMLQPVTDPTQVKQQRIMGLSFAVLMPVFMLLGFFPVPAAFVLYWTFTNILATAQSLRAYRLPLPPLVKVNTKDGGAYPGGGFFAKFQEAQNSQGANGANVNSLNGKTGAPAKHKPKKRK